MKKALLAGLVGTGFLLIVGLLAAGHPQAAAEEPTPWPYVLYVPLVVKSPEAHLSYPLDWCTARRGENLAAGNGLWAVCASARDAETKPVSLTVGSGRAPSPAGGYGVFTARTFLLFPEDSAGYGEPALRISRIYANGTNAARCWVDVHVFSLPPTAWTMPFTITEGMWELVGPRLGSFVVDIPQEEIAVTVPLSGFSPTMVVLSRCESQHELCAVDPYKYGWTLLGMEVNLEWRPDFQP